MAEKETTYQPVAEKERMASLDIMRGFVLCGILIMNINGFGLYEAYMDPTIMGGFTGLNKVTWVVTSMFFEGTMRALFSLLFGVGMFIFLERLEAKGAGIKAADIYFRRLMWLLLFGIIHGYLFLWPGEILFDYAIMGFLVYSFRKLPPKKLLASASILLLIGTTWNYFDYRHAQNLVNDVRQIEILKTDNLPLPDSLKGSDKEWSAYLEKRSPESIAEFVKTHNQGYFTVLGLMAPINMQYESYFFYRYNAWDILSMMLIGIALFKLGILSAKADPKVYLLMVGVGYGIGFTVNYHEVKHILSENFSYLSFYYAGITYDLGRVSVAMGHVGTIMLFAQSKPIGWLMRKIAAIGQMALTNYFMHSLICMFIFTGLGWGLFGKLQRFELLYVVFFIWMFQLIISPIWLKYFQFGPLEWLWRNLSYQKIHPFKRIRS